MAHTFGAGASPLATVTGFDVVSINEGTSKDSTAHMDASGSYVAATVKAFNERTEVTVEYEANTNAEIATQNIAITNSLFNLTSIALRVSNTGHARLTITGHKHGSTAHDAQAGVIALPVCNGFGATCLMGSSLTAADVISSSWTATISHVDRQNNVGDFLCGKAHGVKIEASTEAVSDTEVVTVPEGWTYVGGGEGEGNQDFQTTTLRGVKFQADA